MPASSPYDLQIFLFHREVVHLGLSGCGGRGVDV
jgi:hypothetical protein